MNIEHFHGVSQCKCSIIIFRTIPTALKDDEDDEDDDVPPPPIPPRVTSIGQNGEGLFTFSNTKHF